ncbi:MAG: peptidase S74 [Acidobacteria bacterium]|nr:peptidase S74 [Acidobacteriota bacterium]
MHTRNVVLAVVVLLAGIGGAAVAQPLGTFRWQLQPFCNVVAVAITQNGAVYRLEGTDDQCGNGADAASVTGTAFPNADGTIGFGLNIVTAPGGRPVHVDAEIALGTFSGTWRDSAGAAGTFVLTPGAGNGGTARPLPSAVPSTFVLRPDGGVVATGAVGQGAIPASGPGTRMMWYPGKAAFRAGRAQVQEWDDINVGAYSVALGWGTRASGEADTALGYFAVATGGASIAMGASTLASGNASTAMGSGSLASGDTSTAMGKDSASSGLASTTLGDTTTASGRGALAGGFLSAAAGSAALAFGLETQAVGTASVALGTRTSAGRGSFVFADNANSTSIFSAGTNQFRVRASGGVEFNTNPEGNIGVRLVAGGVQWTSVSDVNAKHLFRDLDGEDLLTRFAAMPVTEWSYKAQDAAIRHIGPTAQDFHAAFGLGEDPLRIGTLDADGVALAGVRALEARSRQQADEVAALRLEVARLRELMMALTAAPR